MFCSGIQEVMYKHILFPLLLITGLLMGSPVVAIDGDMGIPYAPGQEGSLVPRAPGEEPVYGGKGAGIPPLAIAGGILFVLGAGATVYWQIKTSRQARSIAGK